MTLDSSTSTPLSVVSHNDKGKAPQEPQISLPTDQADNDEVPRQHPDLYFPDGSVVLRAGNILFCVQMSLLSWHSKFFKDLFSLAEPDAVGSNTQVENSRPTIRLYDSPDDVAHLLRALYDVDPSFGNHGRSDFSYISGILRLSSKYLVDTLRKKALTHLSTAWPSTLREWDVREECSRSFETETSSHGGLSYPSPVDIINLAREINAPELLPAAFYDLSRYQYTQIFEASDDDPLYASQPHSDPSLALSASDLRRLALGKEAIQQAVVNLVQAMGRNTFRDFSAFHNGAYNGGTGRGRGSVVNTHRRQLSSRACISPAACRREFSELVELATQHYLLDHERGSTDPLYVAEELGQLKAAEYSECKACAIAFETWARRERERMWKLIPLWFRLES